MTFAENPFSAGTYSFTFSGAWSESLLLSLRVIVQLDNGAKQESATKEQFDDATSLRFVSGQSKTVTVSVPCRVGYSCAGTIDTTPPAAPVGTGVTPQGPANNNSPVVAGTAEANTTIQIFSGDATCTATPTTGTVNDAGQFAVIAAVLDNTTTTFYGQVADRAGNAGICVSLNAAIPYIEDSTAPAAPGAPDLLTASDTGLLAGDDTTNDSTPTFTGTIEGFAMVSLYHDGGTLVGTASTTSDGLYSVTSSTLADGIYAFTVRAQDDAGNVSDASAALVVTIDTTPPAAPAAAPDLVAGSDTGSPTDNITRTTTPTFSGTVEIDASVYLYKNGEQVGTATANGSASYSVTSSALVDGIYAFTVKQTDVAGNGSDASASLSVTIDTAIATPGAPDLDAGTDTGLSSVDNITKNTTPMFNGTVEANAAVVLLKDGAQVGTTTADPTGAYAVTASTSLDGTYSFTIKATDPAGNESSASSGLAVKIDTVISTPGAPDLESSSDLGASSIDDITNVTTPTFNGVAEADAGIVLYRGGAPVGSTTADPTGAYAVTSSTTTDGTYLFTVKATDPAGNESNASSSLSVTIDTTPPGAPTLAPDLIASSDTGQSNTDNLTGLTTPTFDGGIIAGDFVRLYDYGALVGTTTALGGTTYVVTASELQQGDHSFTVRAVDTAGNESLDSPALAVTIDSLVDCPPVSDISRVTPNGPVYAMARAGCTIYIGGLFSSVGGQPRSNLAAINFDAGLLPWNPNANNQVRALAVSGGVLYAGGYFTTMDGFIRDRLAAFATDGGQRLSWNPRADEAVNALIASTVSVYAGGSFTIIGGAAQTYLAPLDAITGLLE